ncbi:MAG: hypothetical protein ABR574_12460 [Cryomorphaceae bacterium]
MKILAFTTLLFIINATVLSQRPCDSILESSKQNNALYIEHWLSYEPLPAITHKMLDAGIPDSIVIAPWIELQSIMKLPESGTYIALPDKDTLHLKKAISELILPKNEHVDTITFNSCLNFSGDSFKIDSLNRYQLAPPERLTELDFLFKKTPTIK